MAVSKRLISNYGEIIDFLTTNKIVAESVRAAGHKPEACFHLHFASLTTTKTTLLKFDVEFHLNKTGIFRSRRTQNGAERFS